MGSRVELSTLSLSDFFEEQAPFYISIGMTYNEYWNEAPELARYSLKAYNIRQKREMEHANMLAWLQGSYIESAVYSAVSYCLNGKEAERLGIKYFDEPVDIFGNEKKEDKNAVSKAQQESLEWIRQLYLQTNREFGAGGD